MDQQRQAEDGPDSSGEGDTLASVSQSVSERWGVSVHVYSAHCEPNEPAKEMATAAHSWDGGP